MGLFTAFDTFCSALLRKTLPAFAQGYGGHGRMSVVKLSARGECVRSTRIEPSPNGRRAKLAKKLVLILLILGTLTPNTCFASGKELSLPAKIKTELLQVANESKYNFTSGACLLTIMFMLCYQAQVDQMPDSLKSQFRPQNLALNFASTYFMNFACQFFHELGHGLAKKIVAGCDFKIHLGKCSSGDSSSGENSSGTAQALIDSKYLSLDGFDPNLGFNTAESKSVKKYTATQKIIINLAGGLSGIFGYYLLRTAIFFIQNNFTHRSNALSENFKNAFSHAITFDQIVLTQLFNMLIPMQNGDQLGGDAVKVWQELGVKDSSIKSVADIQPYLMMAAFVALAFKQANIKALDERYISDKILIGLSNYFFQGFAQFKSA
jgi:hypothetical protein